MESDVLVVLLDDCPYAAGERAPTTAIDSAASRPSRDPLPMSLTRPLMFPQSVFSYSDPHTIFLEVETYKLLQHRCQFFPIGDRQSLDGVRRMGQIVRFSFLIFAAGERQIVANGVSRTASHNLRSLSPNAIARSIFQPVTMRPSFDHRQRVVTQACPRVKRNCCRSFVDL
jgi:hypothetical protein